MAELCTCNRVEWMWPSLWYFPFTEKYCCPLVSVSDSQLWWISESPIMGPTYYVVQEQEFGHLWFLKASQLIIMCSQTWESLARECFYNLWWQSKPLDTKWEVIIQNFIICLRGKDSGMMNSGITWGSQCTSTNFLALMTKLLQRGRSPMVKARMLPPPTRFP